MHPARDWQQIKQQMALELAGSAEGGQALADSKKFGALADEIELLRDALIDVLRRIEKSEEWWINVPDRGGFDTDMIEAALKETK